MIIGTVIYTLLETFLKLIESGCVWIANKILDDAITVFSADENIFVTFINLIPFASTINLSAIIKGTAYGTVMLLMVISIVKSFISPFTGDDSINPAQAAIRAALAIVLIGAIFGSGYWGKNYVYYGGLFRLVGKWFGTILSKVGAIPSRGLSNLFSFKLNPVEYLAGILLELALLTSIIGAALQYVERIISFAMYIIIGPIAVAMYASRDTENICRDWMMGVLSQFVAIFISLIMWISFIECARDGDNTLLHYAIMIAILGVMRNSEKIINAFGLQTMKLGDSARAAVAGVGVITSTVMMSSRFAALSHKRGGSSATNIAGSTSMYAPGTVSAYNSAGVFGNTASMKMGQAQRIASSAQPITAIRNASAQNKAMSSVKNALESGASIDARTLNTAMGLNSSTSVHAIGNGENSMLQPASVVSAQGTTVQGFVGDAAFNKGGQVEIVKDAFFAANSEPGSIDRGASIQFNGDYSGSDHYISGGGPVVDNHNNFVYRTSFENPDVSFSDVKESIDFAEISKGKPVKEIVHKARNV